MLLQPLGFFYSHYLTFKLTRISSWAWSKSSSRIWRKHIIERLNCGSTRILFWSKCSSNEQQMKFNLSGKFLPLKDCTIIIKMDITPYMWLHQNPILVQMFIDSTTTEIYVSQEKFLYSNFIKNKYNASNLAPPETNSGPMFIQWTASNTHRLYWNDNWNLE